MARIRASFAINKEQTGVAKLFHGIDEGEGNEWSSL